MYLDAEHGLEKVLDNNMTSAAYGLLESQDQVKIIAYYDGSTYKTNDTKIYEINPYKKEGEWKRDVTALVDFITNGEADSGSYITLGNYLKWALSTYNPENKRKVIVDIGGHGAGSYGRYTGKILLTNRTICPDRTSNTFITTDEMPKAFEIAGLNKNNKLDLIVYDTCLTATIEEAYEIRDYFKYFISSPNNIPGEGIPYEKVISNISNNDSIISVGNKIIKYYSEKYFKGGVLSETNYTDDTKSTLTFIDLSEMENLCTALNKYSDFFCLPENKDLLKYLNGKKNCLLINNFKNNKYYNPDDSISYPCCFWWNYPPVADKFVYYSFDIGYLTDITKKYAILEENSELANICTEIQSSLQKAIINSWKSMNDPKNNTNYYSTLNSENYYGLTIAGLYNSSTKFNIYSNSNFAFNSATSWGKLLELIK